MKEEEGGCSLKKPMWGPRSEEKQWQSVLILNPHGPLKAASSPGPEI